MTKINYDGIYPDNKQETPKVVCPKSFEFERRDFGWLTIKNTDGTETHYPIDSPLPPDVLLKFNNALEADALDWDTRNLKPGEGMLLTDSQIIHDALEVLHTEKEGYLLIAKAIRADEKTKCHQSETVRIKELETEISTLKYTIKMCQIIIDHQTAISKLQKGEVSE
jgi:hypothetical protein